MPNIRYHEYRPGRWVKVVDGQAVGPATDEEVAAWKREVEAQSSIWEDVVKAAGPAEPAKRAREPETLEVPWPPPARGRPRSEAADDQGTPSADSASSDREAAPLTSAAEAADSASVSRLLRTVDEIRAAKRSAKPVARRSARARASEGSPARAKAEGEASPDVTAPAAQAAPPAPAEEGRSVEEAPAEAAAHPPELAEKQLSERTPAVSEMTGALAASADVVEALGLRIEVTEAAERPLPERLAPAAVPEEAMRVEPARSVKGPKPEEESEAQTETPGEPSAEEEPGQEAAAPELDEAIALAEELAEVKPGSGVISATDYVEESVPVWETELSTETRDDEAVEQEPPEPGRGRAPSGAQRRAAKTQTRTPRTRERKGHVYVWFEAAPADDLVAAVRAGMAKYKERFDQAAGAVLCHSIDLPTLEQARLGLDVRPGKNVPPRNFWIGPK